MKRNGRRPTRRQDGKSGRTHAPRHERPSFGDSSARPRPGNRADRRLPSSPSLAPMREFRVAREEAGTRLRNYLSDRLALSGNRAKTLLDARQVFVNGQRVWMAGHALAANDIVRVLIPQDPRLPNAALPTMRMLYEDALFLVIDKPAGMLSNGPQSVESRLREERGEPELAAAHRLDQDTSGCLLVARTTAAFEAAVALFRAHSVDKEYEAIVMGRPRPPQQTIDAPIEGLSAVTRLRTLRASDHASHLALQTLTGRTHQIRRHLAGIKHPVLGDRQYGPQRGLAPAFMQIPRQMLHAAKLQFPHPTTGKPISVQATLPTDFRQCLQAFGLGRE